VFKTCIRDSDNGLTSVIKNKQTSTTLTKDAFLKLYVNNPNKNVCPDLNIFYNFKSMKLLPGPSRSISDPYKSKTVLGLLPLHINFIKIVTFFF